MKARKDTWMYTVADFICNERRYSRLLNRRSTSWLYRENKGIYRRIRGENVYTATRYQRGEHKAKGAKYESL